MPTVKTGYWVRVEGDKVKDVWDTSPDTRPGWREAVEVIPDIAGRDREILTGHTFDLTKTPVEIVYSKREVTYEERRDSYLSHARIECEMIVTHQNMLKEMGSEEFSQAAIDEAIAKKEARIAALNSVTSHDDIDALDE